MCKSVQKHMHITYIAIVYNNLMTIAMKATVGCKTVLKQRIHFLLCTNYIYT